MPRTIKIDWDNLADFQTLERPFPHPERTLPGIDEINPETFPDFLDNIGLKGMGGGGFPASEKLRANKNSHTVVINGIECEPGITIDKSVLLNEFLLVATGAKACATAIGAEHIILAIQADETQRSKLRNLYPEFDIVCFPKKYPAGAEKLILKRLTGSMPPPGARPFQYGYLIQNVISIRAIGRALVDGIQVVERPLTLAMPSIRFYKNIIVPIGLSIRDVLAIYSLSYDPDLHLIVDSGLMMGRQAEPDDLIDKTTLSLLIIQRDSAWKEERPCTHCGACNIACPLGLHPVALTERIRKNKTGGTAFKTQMTECFLCGVCAAVCPSGIPLVQSLKKGKQCL